MLSVVQYFYAKVPSSIPLNSLISYPVAAGRFVADRLYFGCRRYTHNIAHTADTIPGAVSLLNPTRKIDSEAYRSTAQRLSQFYASKSPAINSVELAPILPAVSFIVNSFGSKDLSSIRTSSLIPGTVFPSARTVRAVFTDFDGTIGSTDKYHIAGYNDAFATIGVTQAMTQEEYDQWSYTDDAGVLSFFAQARGLELSRDVINVLVRIKQQATLKHLKGAPVLFPHAVEFFRALNSLHIPLILVSMADRPVVEQCLRNSNALSLFSHLITCEDVAQGKPHPEPYQRALKHLNEQLLATGDKQLVSPAEVMVLEDTFGGVTSGHAFGGTVVAMTHTTPVPRLQAAKADFTCDSLADLGALFFRDILSAAQRLTVHVPSSRLEVELVDDPQPARLPVASSPSSRSAEEKSAAEGEAHGCTQVIQQ